MLFVPLGKSWKMLVPSLFIFGSTEIGFLLLSQRSKMKSQVGEGRGGAGVEQCFGDG